MCASLSCYVPIIVKTRNIKNGRYIATYLGNAVRSTWPRILYIWEKAKGCSSTNYRHRSIFHSVFYIERIHACNCRRRFSGSTLFCENIRLITVGGHLKDGTKVTKGLFRGFCPFCPRAWAVSQNFGYNPAIE